MNVTFKTYREKYLYINYILNNSVIDLVDHQQLIDLKVFFTSATITKQVGTLE